MPIAKLSIHSLDETDDKYTLEVQFNPKELQVDKAVQWSAHKTSKADAPILEFTGADGRSMSLELVFDGYESNTDVEAAYVSKLVALATVRDSSSKQSDPKKQRPHLVGVTWGGSIAGSTGASSKDSKVREFRGVIESVNTKYTMFSPEGVPLRATVNVKFKQADSLEKADKGGAAGGTPAK